MNTYFSSAERRDSSPEMMRSLSRPFSEDVTRPDFSKSDTERSRPLRVPCLPTEVPLLPPPLLLRPPKPCKEK